MEPFLNAHFKTILNSIFKRLYSFKIAMNSQNDALGAPVCNRDIRFQSVPRIRVLIYSTWT